MDKYRWGAFVGGVVVGFFVAYLVLKLGPLSPTSFKFKVTDPTGKGGVELEVKGDEINYERILQHVYASPILGPGVTDWLEKNQELYPLREASLVGAIERELCDPIPTEPLDTYLRKAEECAAQKVPSGIRPLCFTRKPPFHYVGMKAKLGVPKPGPPEGKANVCRENGLLGRTLEVVDPVSRRSITVKATGQYQCTKVNNFPDLQLSAEDALDLLRRPLNKIENVIVVPLT